MMLSVELFGYLPLNFIVEVNFLLSDALHRTSFGSELR